MDADQTLETTQSRSTAAGSKQLLCGCLLFLAMGIFTCAPALAGQQTLSDVNQLLTSGRIGQAAELLRSMDQAEQSGRGSSESELTLYLAIAARAFEQANNTKDACELYQRAISASKRESAKELPADKLRMVRLAAASTLARAAKYDAAVTAVQLVLNDASALPDDQLQLIVKLCLHVGSEALSSSQGEVAERAYDLAAKHSGDAQRATAMLGAGWAAATQQTKPKEAAEKLAAFVEAYGAHDDAPRAAALQITCLRLAGSNPQADEVMKDLLERWPHSTAANEAVSQYRPAGKVLPCVTAWLAGKADPGQFQSLAQIAASALVTAAQSGDEEPWDGLVGRLAAADSSGNATTEAFQQLSKGKLQPHAQRLAADLIDPKPDAEIQAACREAACRWAGRQQMWSMLALASESSNPDADDPSRTVAIERLFAEALIQAGRQSDSHKWWVHLVDHREVDDFPTLLRCAEAATSVADVSEAKKRIEAAGAATKDDPARIALVDMLAADLAIRKLEFDQARTALEKVVQSDQSVKALRSRAQWMIGETYFLQHKFADAIEAYRRVEGIEPSGPWVVAALIQAGKAFEQLGRNREAAICYSSLVSRFGDSEHASVARRRLAAIAPQQNSPESDSPSETIRR